MLFLAKKERKMVSLFGPTTTKKKLVRTDED